MIKLMTHTLWQPFECNSPVDGFIVWRARMEEMLRTGHGDMIALMHAINHIASYRRQMAPEELISCPDCDGRGMWVDSGNHWCRRCSGTGSLLTSELTDPAEIALCHWVTKPPERGKLS